MERVSNPFQACNDIFFKPNRVFATLAEKHNWSWLAFIFVMTLTILPSYFYFSFVDFSWYIDTIISNTMADQSPAEHDNVRNMMTRELTLYGSVASIFIMVLIMNAILAIYLNLTTKQDEENLHGFTDWYGFTWWVSMPVIIGSIISIFLILLADNHEIMPTVASPTSIAYLFNVEMSSKWFSFAQSLRIESFWTMYLIAVGLSQWTRLESKTTYIIATAPYFVIWLIWAGVIML